MEKLIKINSDFDQVIDINQNTTYNFIDISETSNDIKIIFNMHASAIINFSSLTWNNHKNINVTINLNHDNCDIKLNVNSLTINNWKTEIILCGINTKDVNNNYIDMQISGILSNNKSSIKCIPIYKFNTNKINATHGLTIGNFNEDEIFSLLSKGINQTYAKTMMICSKFNETLKSLPEDERNDYYKFILNKWGDHA